MRRVRGIVTAVAIVTALAGCDAEASGGQGEDDGHDGHDDAEDAEDDEIVAPDGGSGFRLDGGPGVPARLAELVVAERPPPAISGGTLAVSDDGALAVAADPDRDVVYVVNVALGTTRTVALTADSEPGRVVLDPAGHAHVVLRNKGALARVDLAAGTVAAETPVCQLPRGVAYDDAKRALWVACASGELVALDANTHTELVRKFVELDLRDIVINKAGERFVSRYRSAELLHFAEDGAVLSRSAPLAVKSQRFNVPVTSPPIEKSSDAGRGAAPPLDAGFFGPVEVTMTPTLGWKTVRAVDGNPLMLHQRSQQDEVVITQGGYGGGCQTITQASVTRYDQDGKPRTSITLGGPALSVDVAASPDGRMLAVAVPGAYLTGQGGVQVLSADLLSTEGEWRGAADAGADTGAALPMPRDAGAIAADAGPRGTAAIDASFVPGFVPADPSQCQFGGSLAHEVQATAVAFDVNGRLFVQSREPAELSVFDGQGSFFEPSQAQRIVLNDSSVRDTGHELFHSDVGSGLACASCHGEALDDGHVWTFRDFGPRRTQNMRGGMLSTLPLHWEGDMPTFQHLVDEVMTRRMGGFKVEPKYATALATWIDAQPAIQLVRAESPAVVRGKALFESTEVGCATCHAGALLTNDQTVDVGTGARFQVPSLLGLALRGPFMHDGCASTLIERFDPDCGGDAHGTTSQLTSEQLQDLVAYLETL